MQVPPINTILKGATVAIALNITWGRRGIVGASTSNQCNTEGSNGSDRSQYHLGRRSIAGASASNKFSDNL